MSPRVLKDRVEVECRVWLRENGYEDIAAIISDAMMKWREDGNGTRRNWWDILAGTPAGKVRFVDGIRFPILQVARRRKGWPLVTGALQRSTNEQPPAMTTQSRWVG